MFYQLLITRQYFTHLVIKSSLRNMSITGGYRCNNMVRVDDKSKIYNIKPSNLYNVISVVHLFSESATASVALTGQSSNFCSTFLRAYIGKNFKILFVYY